MTLQFFDVHSHLHDERIYTDLSNIVDRAEKVDVRHMVSCATRTQNFDRTAVLACTYRRVIPCFGIHPWFVDTLSENWQQQLESFLMAHRSGIGETGLDFMDKRADQDLQVLVFSHHLALARELEKPINIHIRKAWDRFIHLLKKFGPLKTPGLIHSYSGSLDMVPLFEKYNLYISFSGAVTRPNARKVVRALGAVSKERFVIETDAPDIYPCLSGPRESTIRENTIRENTINEPKNLPVIAQIAARRVNMGFEKFAAQAYNNSLKLFSSILPHEKLS